MMSKKYENFVFIKLNQSRGLSYESFKVINLKTFQKRKLLKAEKLKTHVKTPKSQAKYDIAQKSIAYPAAANQSMYHF